MDHSKAIEEKFAERYLLGELTPAQRDEFEEHFFDCGVCASEVEAGAVFIDNARAVVREEPPAKQALYGLPFQAIAFAFVCLLCVTGYENIVTIPKLRSTGSGMRVPQILPAVSLIGMGARAEENPAPAPAGKDFQLELDIPGGPEFTGYFLEIRDARKDLKFSLPVTTEQAKDTVRIAIPAASLSAGKYDLSVMGVVPGKPNQQLVRDPIAIQ
jgi:hypothetical protein